VKLVNNLQAAGFYVILDLHWSAPGSQIALSQNPAPDEDHSPAFWSSVASTFGSDGGVLFDLYNEPYFYWTTQERTSGSASAGLHAHRVRHRRPALHRQHRLDDRGI